MNDSGRIMTDAKGNGEREGSALAESVMHAWKTWGAGRLQYSAHIGKLTNSSHIKRPREPLIAAYMA